MLRRKNIKNEIVVEDIFSFVIKNGDIEFFSICFKKFETKDSYIYLANPNDSNISLNKLESIDNVKNHTFELEGIWTAVIKSKTDNEIKILVSTHNELCWYYNEETRSASTNIFLLSKYLNKIEFDNLSIASFLSFDFCYSRDTFVKNIKKTYGGDVIYIKDRIKVVPLDLVKWLGFDRSISDERILLKSIRHLTNSVIEEKKNIEITLTGGADSRAILGLVNSITSNYDLMIGNVSTVDRRDVRVAKKISRLLNKNIILVDESNKKVMNKEIIFDSILYLTNGNFIPRNYVLFYKEFISDRLFENKNRFMGYRGEFFKGFYSNVLSTIHTKSSLLNNSISSDLIEKVLRIYNYYQTLDLLNSRELFYHRERDNFWVSSNIRAFLQGGLKIYTPFGFNELLALGYRTTKGIKNANLHSQLIGLLDKKISRISTKNIRLFSIFKKLRPLKNNYNFFIEPHIIKGNFDEDIVLNIIGEKKFERYLNLYEKFGKYDAFVHKYLAVSRFKSLIFYFNTIK